VAAGFCQLWRLRRAGSDSIAGKASINLIIFQVGIEAFFVVSWVEFGTVSAKTFPANVRKGEFSYVPRLRKVKTNDGFDFFGVLGSVVFNQRNLSNLKRMICGGQ
jgi:hypothetical protein